ncbi:NmrA family NAD(P)-binding protein [Solitalea canadensis]|uniref:Putative nucleoside-diphosphate sugar epimerase n=1 Tax=Solitalea canadensis (strain ATCC 29591 / DSM 3403 / JCM 21819 / LMG 8368 / NBRC 15130 / NCIMB 12057 / USAM 9D) TaxID=929556 RepID=H8KUX5_SOLCM|nr:NmrA family NAD(P)-binding protein [Solitalea canadensis]AFD07675.1 putative nucleoside-diphosphate sugar epimerase [Solitalea canadensis DSM 3403]
MKFTITGSLGNIGNPLTQLLVAAGHKVIVVSSSADRTAAIEALGAQAAIGSVSDALFLKDAFNRADAVFAMTPPNMGGQDVIANTIQAGKALASAIREAGVKRVVMLSSVGADLPGGNGPIASLHNIEKLYNELPNVSITFLRAGYFYTNFYNDIPLIKGMGIIGSNFPATTRIPLVHPNDIAAAVAEELQKTTTGKNVRYIVSDVRTPADLAKVLGTAIGKSELPWVEFTDEQSLQGLMQAGLPEEIAKLYTEMGTGFRSGKIQADFELNDSPVTGATKLEEFAQQFASKF